MISVVGDASPLICFHDTDKIELLRRLFDEILIPREVKDEVYDRKPRVKPGWIKIKDLLSPSALSRFVELKHALHPGEAAAIALAEQSGLKVFIDEVAGATRARALGVAVIRTHDVLQHLCELKHLKPGAAHQLTIDMLRSGSKMDPFVFQPPQAP